MIDSLISSTSLYWLPAQSLHILLSLILFPLHSFPTSHSVITWLESIVNLTSGHVLRGSLQGHKLSHIGDILHSYITGSLSTLPFCIVVYFSFFVFFFFYFIPLLYSCCIFFLCDDPLFFSVVPLLLLVYSLPAWSPVSVSYQLIFLCCIPINISTTELYFKLHFHILDCMLGTFSRYLKPKSKTYSLCLVL